MKGVFLCDNSQASHLFRPFLLGIILYFQHHRWLVFFHPIDDDNRQYAARVIKFSESSWVQVGGQTSFKTYLNETTAYTCICIYIYIEKMMFNAMKNNKSPPSPPTVVVSIYAGLLTNMKQSLFTSI